jgi:predicted enzyme related to lactoylglutathione lyase
MKITTVLSHERIAFLPTARSSRPGSLLGDKGHEHAAACREHDNKPRRRLPQGEQAKGRESETDIGRAPDRARPYRVIERGQEQPDHRRVDPAQRGLAMLSRGNLRLLLNTPTGTGGAARPMPDGQRPEPGGWNRIQLQVDDLAREVEVLRSAGGRFRSDIIAGNGGRQILLDDPAGNPIELFEPRRE